MAVAGWCCHGTGAELRGGVKTKQQQIRHCSDFRDTHEAELPQNCTTSKTGCTISRDFPGENYVQEKHQQTHDFHFK